MWNDLRFSLRTLRHAPGFTLLAVLSLALGIGANTAIFSLIYQVVMRALPVKDPGSLVSLESNDYVWGWTRRDNNQTVLSSPMYQALRDRNQVFDGLLARVSFPATLAWNGNAVSATAEVVSGNFFQVLGMAPALGRLLLPADDALAQTPVIVLSHGYWETHLGADPDVVNRQILLNSKPVLVVGVAPRGFRSLLPGRDPDLFAPLAMMDTISAGWDKNAQPDAYWLNLVGRLRPGISRARAEAMLLPLFRSVIHDELAQMKGIDSDARQKMLGKPLRIAPAAQGLNMLREQWQTPLAALMVMVGLVLLIACANVANLLVARATARQREMAIRLAVGAGRWRLVRQLMVESGILAIAGGVLGLLLSQFLAEGLLSLLPADAAGGWLNAQLNMRLLGYSLAVSLLTGLLFGLAPALQAMRYNVAPALKEQGTGISAGGPKSRFRQGLIVAQVAISLLLLVGAGLFTRSLVNLLHIDPGFQADRLVTFTVDPSLSGYSLERRLALFGQLRDKLASLPGVESAAGAQLIPLGGWGWGNGVKAPGTRNADDKYVPCAENSVGPRYFRTLGIPLLAGRDFDDSDSAAAAKVAIISESFARFLYGRQDPIGRTIQIGSNNAEAQIVGVVQNSRYGDLREKSQQVLYVPYPQGGDEFTRQAAFFVRALGGEKSVMSAVPAVVKSLDPNLPVDRLTSMRMMIDDSVYTDRMVAVLAVAFGLLAAILAAVGLYGVVSYSVARRTREFGIRLALGAEPHSVLMFVMREVGWLLAAGVVVGLPASYVLARVAESQLYGVRAHDPGTLAAATLLIAVTGLFAGLAPAMRAMRIQPVLALRDE